MGEGGSQSSSIYFFSSLRFGRIRWEHFLLECVKVLCLGRRGVFSSTLPCCTWFWCSSWLPALVASLFPFFDYMCLVFVRYNMHGQNFSSGTVPLLLIGFYTIF